MEGQIVFRPAIPADAGRIVDLIRGGFSPEFLGMIPMGCHGAEAYCRAQIEWQDAAGDSVYTVAEVGGHVVGCIELRLLPDTLFLNYVCIDPAVRSRGIARALLDHAVESARTPAHEAMILDVLEDNLVARRWYERLGFIQESRTDWLEVRLPRQPYASGYIGGGPQATALDHLYGFSQITVSTRSGRYPVGLLADAWLRVTDAQVLADHNAVGLLQERFPERAFLLLAEEDPDGSGMEMEIARRARTLRLRLPLEPGKPIMGSRDEVVSDRS